MRIVAGTARGLLLSTVPKGVRPTSDRVREGVFNILGQFFEGGEVLDLYAGTGAMGIEAISRGCERGVFVERSGQAVASIEKNLQRAGFLDRAEVVRDDVGRAVGRVSGGFHLIFADPPYRIARSNLADVVGALSPLLAPEGWVVVESAQEIEGGTGLEKWTVRRYGETVITIFAPQKEGREGSDLPRQL